MSCCKEAKLASFFLVVALDHDKNTFFHFFFCMCKLNFIKFMEKRNQLHLIMSYKSIHLSPAQFQPTTPLFSPLSLHYSHQPGSYSTINKQTEKKQQHQMINEHFLRGEIRQGLRRVHIHFELKTGFGRVWHQSYTHVPRYPIKK